MKITRTTYQSLIENAIVLSLFVGGALWFIYLKTAGLASVFENRFSAPFELSEALVKASVGGLLLGLLIITFEARIFPRATKYLKLHEKRVVWTVSILAIIGATVFVTHSTFEYLAKGATWEVAFERGRSFLATGLFISFLFYYFIVSLLVSFLRQLRHNFGEAVFYNYLTGQYSRPEIEKRTFMFLDLDSSTHLAEILGHVKYSRLLNRFFDDVLDALDRFGYEVYQFVGDEVVFTWKADGTDNGKAIEMYRAVKEHLQKLQIDYIEKFGVFPTFKCAVSTGKVTGTLIGRKRRNIAYHGDVLNTTARLLAQCGKYGKGILFTDFYLKSLQRPLSFQPQYLTSIVLRGKEKTSKIYAKEQLS